MTAPPIPQREAPFWGFGEVFLSAATFLLSLELIVTVARHFLGDDVKLGYWAVLAEFAAYVVLFAILKALFFWQGHPLLKSLAWVPQQAFSAANLIVFGLLLFFAGVVLEIVLRMPVAADSPFEKMMYADRFSPFVVAAFGVTIAPVIEELLFRGLLQPVLVNAAGVFGGILITSVLFAAVHLPQNALIWQSAVVIAVAGFGFGVIRHVSGSTRASTIAHIAYNSLPFAVTLMQGAPPVHK
jgi:membrane protease YdiL (CAAX protease family)